MSDRLPIAAFNRLRKKHGDIIVIVSPPRCSSTAFARVFWEHPSVGYYAHEPFETMYYMDGSLNGVVEKLNNPLELKGPRYQPVIRNSTSRLGTSISTLTPMNGWWSTRVVPMLSTRVQVPSMAKEATSLCFGQRMATLIHSALRSGTKLKKVKLLSTTMDLINHLAAVTL